MKMKGLKLAKFNVEHRVEELKTKLENVKAILIFDRNMRSVQKLMREGLGIKNKRPEDFVIENIKIAREMEKIYLKKCLNAKSIEEKQMATAEFAKGIEQLSVMKIILSKDSIDKLKNGSFKDLDWVAAWARMYKEAVNNGCSKKSLYVYKSRIEDKLKDYQMYVKPKNILEINGIDFKFENTEENSNEIDKENPTIEEELMDDQISLERCEELFNNMAKEKSEQFKQLKEQYSEKNGARPTPNIFKRVAHYFVSLFGGDDSPEQEWDKNFKKAIVLDIKNAIVENSRKRLRAEATYIHDKEQFEEKFFDKLLSARQQKDVEVKVATPQLVQKIATKSAEVKTEKPVESKIIDVKAEQKEIEKKAIAEQQATEKKEETIETKAEKQEQKTEDTQIKSRRTSKINIAGATTITRELAKRLQAVRAKYINLQLEQKRKAEEEKAAKERAEKERQAREIQEKEAKKAPIVEVLCTQQKDELDKLLKEEVLCIQQKEKIDKLKTEIEAVKTDISAIKTDIELDKIEVVAKKSRLEETRAKIEEAKAGDLMKTTQTQESKTVDLTKTQAAELVRLAQRNDYDEMEKAVNDR